MTADMQDKVIVTEAMVAAVAWSASSQPGQPFGMILTDDDIRNILTIGLANAPAALSIEKAPAVETPNDVREALGELERYVALSCYDQWLPEGHAKSSQLSRLLDRCRSALEATR